MATVPTGSTDTPTLPTAPPIDGVRWAEPTSRLPLRWGGYSARYSVGLAVLVAAALAVYWPNSTLGLLLVVGIVVAGVIVTPATAGRRALAALVALTGYALWGFSLTFGFFGSGAWRASEVVTGVLAVLAWLILRERSGRTYAVALPVGAVAVLVVSSLGGVIWNRVDLGNHWWLAGASVILGWVGAAWLARAVEPRFSVGRTGREAGREAARELTQAQAAARGIDEQVRQMAELQAAWERAHPGQPMPAVAAPMLARSGGDEHPRDPRPGLRDHGWRGRAGHPGPPGQSPDPADR